LFLPYLAENSKTGKIPNSKRSYGIRIWNLEFELWNLEFELWNLEFELWNFNNKILNLK
jgi:hypothetical protein